MKYSLVSREVIADSIEVSLSLHPRPSSSFDCRKLNSAQGMHEGYLADAIITLGGCDKSARPTIQTPPHQPLT